MFYSGRKSTIKSQLILIAGLSVFYLLLVLIAGSPGFIEQYYSEGIYPIICKVQHPLLNTFPFSVGDLLYISIIGYFIYLALFLVKLLCKRAYKNALNILLRIVVIVQCLVLIFYLFWGLNYFRLPMAGRLNLRDSNYTTAELKAVTAMLIDSANACRARVNHKDLLQNNNIIYKEAVLAVEKLSDGATNFRAVAPEIKSSLLTPLLNYMGTSGYFNPFTGEAQINYEMPVFDRPVVACHEMSHQMGCGGEDEANFVGFLAGIGSNNNLLKYSSYRLAVDEFMHALWYRDSLSAKALKATISTAVHNDFKAERTYWLSYQSKIDILTGIFYDRFLKVNNQPHGLGSYNRMVLLVTAFYRRKGP